MIVQAPVYLCRTTVRKRAPATGPAPQGHNLFVLVNHSPTLYVNPPSRSFGGECWPIWPVNRSRDMDTMVGPRNPKDLPASPPAMPQPSGTTRRTAVGLILGAPLLGACAGSFSNPFNAQAGPSGPAAEPVAVGTGQVKIGLILPLSASGNAGVAAQSMKNAAEMALAEFQNHNIQLLIKDDGGSAPGAQQAAQQALEGGAEIILGPLF